MEKEILQDMSKYNSQGISNIAAGFSRTKEGSSIFNSELKEYAIANRHKFDNRTIASLTASIPGYLATIPDLIIKNEHELKHFI